MDVYPFSERHSADASAAALRPRVVAALALVAAVGQFILLAVYRRVNLDEGWYLWASKLVYEGQLLYRDFAYTQTPLLPYVYGAVQQATGAGLYQGRVISVVFGLLMFVLSARVATRLAGQWAGVWCLLLLTASLYAAAHFVYVATYALTAFLMLAALAVALNPAAGTRTNTRSAFAAVLISLAVAVRVSVLAAMAPFLLYLILSSPRRGQAAVVVVLTSLVTLGATVGILALSSGPLMLYDVMGFHFDRMITLERHLNMVFDSAWRTFREFAILLLICLLGFGSWLGLRWRRRDWRSAFWQRLPELTIGAMTLGLMLAHALPRTTDSYYHTLETPLLCILGGVMLVRSANHVTPRWRRRSLVLFAALLVGVHAILQTAAVFKSHLITLPPQNQIAIVRAAADYLRRHTVNPTLLTFDTHLALEAGMEVPPGLEMSIFAYRPTWTTEQAQRFRVVNNDMLIAYLKQGMGAVALTQFDIDLLYGDRDRVLQTLHDHYRLAKTVPGFDPYDGPLSIYLPPQFTLPDLAHPLETPWDDNITLRGYELNGERFRPGDDVALTLYWQAQASPVKSYTVFTHIVDAAGSVVAGWDNPPCRGVCPTSTWRPGEVLRDEYTIPLPASLPPGVYTLQTGLYDPTTGERLQLLNDGHYNANAATLTAIEVVAHPG